MENIRTAIYNGQTYYCAKDIARMLNVSKTYSKQYINLYAPNKVLLNAQTAKGTHPTNFVPRDDAINMVEHRNTTSQAKKNTLKLLAPKGFELFFNVFGEDQKTQADASEIVESPLMNQSANQYAESANLSLVNTHGIDGYEKDGVVYLKLENVARGLGFTQVKNGVEYIRWETVTSYLNEIKLSQQDGKILPVPTWGHDDYIPENVFYRLAMKAKNTIAERFQALVADEIIPSIRRHGMYCTPSIKASPRIQSEIFSHQEATNLLFSDPSTSALDIREGIVDVIKGIAYKRREPSRQRVWRELYQGVQEGFHISIYSRDKDKTDSFLDAVEHDEWFAMVIQVSRMAEECGLPIKEFLTQTLALRFAVVVDYFNRAVTLLEARTQLALPTPY